MPSRNRSSSSAITTVAAGPPKDSASTKGVCATSDEASHGRFTSLIERSPVLTQAGSRSGRDARLHASRPRWQLRSQSRSKCRAFQAARPARRIREHLRSRSRSIFASQQLPDVSLWLIGRSIPIGLPGRIGATWGSMPWLPRTLGGMASHSCAQRGARVPPGQYVTGDFPVLSAGPTPHTPLREWTFEIRGAVAEPISWTWDELVALPSEKPRVDIHCVTKWSKLDTAWRGVSVDMLLGGPRDGRGIRARLLRRRLHDQPAARGHRRR